MTKANKKTEAAVTTNEVIIPNDITTVSGKIRYLIASGKTRSEVAKVLNIRYQHVRNVMVTPLKRTA